MKEYIEKIRKIVGGGIKANFYLDLSLKIHETCLKAVAKLHHKSNAHAMVLNIIRANQERFKKQESHLVFIEPMLEDAMRNRLIKEKCSELGDLLNEIKKYRNNT